LARASQAGRAVDPETSSNILQILLESRDVGSYTLRDAVQFVAILVWVGHFAGAARTFSRAKEEPPSPLIYVFSMAVFVLIYWSFRGPFQASMAIPGLVGLVGSLVLFESARRSVRGRFFSYIYSNDTPEFLWTSGPYTYIRNPFYASYLLSYIAAAIMFPGVASLAVVLVMTVYFNVAARFEERKFGRSPLATEYKAYLQRTGRFIPRLRFQTSANKP